MLKRYNVVVVLLCIIVGVLLSTSLVSAQAGLGTADNPIQVYFVPSVEAGIITAGGDVMSAALEKATGLKFKVSVPTSYAATIEAMCAAPDSSIGFIPAAGYVLASERCGVDVAAKAVRNGWGVYWTQYIVRRDSDIYTFGDLNGKTWGYGDTGSTSGYVVPTVELAKAGIKASKTVETGGHPQTVLAVYNGEVDFGTTFYSPPLMPEGRAAWQVGDTPEPYDLTVEKSFVSEDGKKLFVGDTRILDARANVISTNPDVVEKVRILRISQSIPNDTLSFGPKFPADVRDKIMSALADFAKTDDWKATIGDTKFYGWSGITPAADSEYDVVRDMIAQVPALADKYK